MTRGWIPWGRAADADPLLNPPGELRPKEALLYLSVHADAQTGELATSVRALAREWGWEYSRTRRFLAALAERGYIEIQAETRAGVTLTIPRPWDGSRIRCESGFESGGASNEAGFSAEVNQGLNQKRISGGPPPSSDNSSPYGGEQEKNYSPAGAYTRGEEPRPAHSVQGFAVQYDDVARLVELVRVLGLHEIPLEGEPWSEQARPVREMIRRYGAEATEQAIRGAPETWPFKTDRSFTAADVLAKFVKCRATAIGQSQNGNGRNPVGRGKDDLARMGISLPDHLSSHAAERVFQWVGKHPEEAPVLVSQAKDAAEQPVQVGGKLVALVMERVRAEEEGREEKRAERQREKLESAQAAWVRRMDQRIQAAVAAGGGEDFERLKEAKAAGAERAKTIPALGALKTDARRAKLRELVRLEFGTLIGDPMPIG